MEFTNLWSWWIVVLIVTVGIAAYSYFWNPKPISIRLKIALIMLRFLALGLLLFCLILKPAMVKEEEKRIRSNLLVLVDTSQSMAIADAPNNGSTTKRLTAVQKSFLNPKNQIYSKLADRFDLQLYRFDSQCEGIDLGKNETGKLLQADGVFTDVGNALSTATNDWKGQPIAGVVLLTDGRNNTGGNPFDIARSLNAPIYPIGVGNPVAPKDVKLVKIEAPPVAYVDHLVPVNVTLNSNGYDGEKIQLRLLQGQKVVDSTFVTLDETSPQQTINFDIKPKAEGNLSYVVSLPGLEGELTTENNRGTFFIKAIKARLKVLFIDSRPRWEYAFLKRALERDPNVDLTPMILSQKSAAQLSKTLLAKTGKYYPQAGDNLKKFPTTEAELNLYDVLILGDMRRTSFTPQQLSMIKNFVETRGKAVIFLGGKNSLSRVGFGSGELKNLLPVIVPQNGSFIRDEDFNPVLTAEGFYHPITRLADTKEANEAVWRDLPPLSRLYSGLQLRAGATVLAEYLRVPRRAGRNNLATEPVIVFQRYGNGKTLLIAADGLWNWAFGVWAFKEEANYYSRFWSQTIRWMATRADAKLVNVETNKPKFIPREQVQITARVYNETYQPISDAELSIEISPPTGKPFQIPYNASPEVEGLYSAQFLASEKGTYKITATGSLSGKRLGTDSVEISVQTPLIEFENPQLNEELLKQLAGVSGGVYMPLLQIDTLPSKIKDFGSTITTVHEDELWDSPFILLIAVGILSAEWILRKRKGLV
ncbi:MAG: glutamine amidotransferase [Candidatus Poribacteria bacterium]